RARRPQRATANRSITQLTRKEFIMTHAFASIDVASSVDKVWQLIGGFSSLPDWLPYVRKGETIVERLEKFDNAARSYSYSIIQPPFSISNYLATIRVHKKTGESGCLVAGREPLRRRASATEKPRGWFKESLKMV